MQIKAAGHAKSTIIYQENTENQVLPFPTCCYIQEDKKAGDYDLIHSLLPAKCKCVLP
jgi:hypothetical protein